MAELCTRSGRKLEEMLQSAWAVADAPAQLQGPGTLTDKLQEATTALPCVCGGRWIPGAVAVLQRNGIETTVFAKAVYRALSLGAARGANVACVGAGGCGKSTLLESLEKIFRCAPKPEDVANHLRAPPSFRKLRATGLGTARGQASFGMS